MIRMPIVSAKAGESSPFTAIDNATKLTAHVSKRVCFHGYGSYVSLLASTQHDMLGNK
jgi:hypothetical protein